MKKAAWIAVVVVANLAALPWTWRICADVKNALAFPLLMFGAHSIVSAFASLPFGFLLKEARCEEPLDLRRQILGDVPSRRTPAKQQGEAMEDLSGI